MSRQAFWVSSSEQVSFIILDCGHGRTKSRISHTLYNFSLGPFLIRHHNELIILVAASDQVLENSIVRIQNYFKLARWRNDQFFSMGLGRMVEVRHFRSDACWEKFIMVDEQMADASDWPGRWNHVRKFLERGGPFAHPDFEPSQETLDFLLDTCQILIIGAGGLGCELLKNLALMGFRNIHVIDMDTIELSNLNRQFLFRPKDVGKSKAEVAASFVNMRIPGCKVVPHFNKIQEFDESFYRRFHIVVCGLDSIVARRWINNMLVGLLNYEKGMLDQSSIIPVVDGGTEGFKGNARVILPGLTACIECTLDLFPPQVNFPLCTIAHTPRLPEHCIEYVRILLWPKENPFSEEAIDGDNPDHVKWIFEQAQQRAEQFKITGVTYRLTQGVIKHIIPAVASTNAVIAAACATEVFKIATSCSNPLSNYMVFNDSDGLYTFTFEAERKDNCIACSQVPQTLQFSEDSKLQEIIDYLSENPVYQMKSPGITTMINDKSKTLYMQNSSLEEQTKANLKKTLKELGLKDGQEMIVADVTTPNSVIFKLQLSCSMEND